MNYVFPVLFYLNQSVLSSATQDSQMLLEARMSERAEKRKVEKGYDSKGYMSYSMGNGVVGQSVTPYSRH